MIEFTESGDAHFVFQAPQVDKVYLVGDFNDWDPHANPMYQTDDEVWELILNLRSGVYRYLYKSDSTWYWDKDGHCVVTIDGCDCSVIRVPDANGRGGA